MAVAKDLNTTLLMPKATAVWLIDNTALTFRQIADFTGLTEIEIEALANEEIGRGLVGRHPVENGELTQNELDRCQKDPAAKLHIARNDLPTVKSRSKGPRYTPVSKRGDKPDAVAYILKHNPEITDAQICSLIGTTKPTIKSVRDKTHPNTPNMRPRHPAELGLCTYQEFDDASRKGLKAQGKDPDEVRAQKLAEEAAARSSEQDNSAGMAGFDFSNFLSSSKRSAEQEDDFE